MCTFCTLCSPYNNDARVYLLYLVLSYKSDARVYLLYLVLSYKSDDLM
jgi:hypothetical protein